MKELFDQEHFSKRIQKILDEGAYLFAEPMTNSNYQFEGLSYRLGFKGDLNGGVYVRCDKRIGEQVARNLLGLDDGAACPLEMIESSVREILNMIGGTLTADLGKEPGHIRLGTPEPFGNEFPVTELRKAWEVEGHPIAVAFKMEAA